MGLMGKGKLAPHKVAVDDFDFDLGLDESPAEKAMDKSKPKEEKPTTAAAAPPAHPDFIDAKTPVTKQELAQAAKSKGEEPAKDSKKKISLNDNKEDSGAADVFKLLSGVDNAEALREESDDDDFDSEDRFEKELNGDKKKSATELTETEDNIEDGISEEAEENYERQQEKKMIYQNLLGEGSDDSEEESEEQKWKEEKSAEKKMASNLHEDAEAPSHPPPNPFS